MWNQRWILRCPSASLFSLHFGWRSRGGISRRSPCLQELPVDSASWGHPYCHPFPQGFAFSSPGEPKNCLVTPKPEVPTMATARSHSASCSDAGAHVSALHLNHFSSTARKKTKQNKQQQIPCRFMPCKWVNEEGLGWWTRGTEMPVISPLSQAKHFGGRIHRLAWGSDEWWMLV